MSLPPPAKVVTLIEAFRQSKTMFAAVALGIFDRLHDRPSGSRDLAAELDANEAALDRLLDACAGLGFLERRDGLYANSPVADAYLRRSSPHSLAGYILYSNNVLYRLWGNLEDAVREGTHRWKQTFGFDGPIFSHFFQTEEAKRDFLLGMHGFGLLSSPAVVAAFDLSRFRRLVDLGGATGHLASAACERYPHLRAAVFDLPAVVDFARSVASDRVEFIPGDFFEDPLPEADLFAVGRILHDWSEEKIRRLLRKIHDRLPAGGALLIAEKLLDEDKSGPVAAQMQSLNMLVCTEGRERTLSEYDALLRDAGFTNVEGKRTGTPLDAVLAVK
jgi:acetylserotonin N-methyltransferase